jgi:simple sugar transport system ATP-binding protein
MTSLSSSLAVQMRGIVKRFPGVLANDQVDLEVRAGEIHALLGENGAGKSTLMNVLSGMYRQDAGEICLTARGARAASLPATEREGRTGPTGQGDGHLQRVEIGSPRAAIELGIGMVHQHFMLVPTQTVAENVILGLNRPRFILNMGQVEQEIVELARQYHMQVDPSAYIWQLSVGEQQRVEILKLLYRGAEVLILDEPTAVLTPQEAEELGHTLRRMAGEGKAIIFITHKLDEVMAFSDRVTVLRDGRNAATLNTADTNKADLARLMVGREVLFWFDKGQAERGPLVLSLRGVDALNDKGLPSLRQVSLEIQGGEILGVAGVDGNGQRELAEVITGLRRVTGGQVLVRGQDLTNCSPRQFIRAGVSHVPGDRLGMGLAGNLPVSDNLIVKAYRRPPLSSGPFLVRQAISEFARRLIRTFQIATPNPDTPVRMLSGGNLQKTILAREITAGDSLTPSQPALLVAVHPTRGLDVGSIEFTHNRLIATRGQGVAILLISSELDEIMSLSDRIAVMYKGQIMGIVDATGADVVQLGLMMAGESIQPGLGD